MKDAENNKWQKPEDEPLFIAISKSDQDFATAYRRARETFRIFLAALKKPDYQNAINAVKLRLRDNDLSDKLQEDCYVFLWVYGVEEEKSGLFSAEVVELPKSPINDLAIGTKLHFQPDDIHDWMIVRQGHLWGGLTIRIVRERQTAEQKINFDEYSGFSVYEPNLP